MRTTFTTFTHVGLTRDCEDGVTFSGETYTTPPDGYTCAPSDFMDLFLHKDVDFSAMTDEEAYDDCYTKCMTTEYVGVPSKSFVVSRDQDKCYCILESASSEFISWNGAFTYGELCGEHSSVIGGACACDQGYTVSGPSVHPSSCDTCTEGYTRVDGLCQQLDACDVPNGDGTTCAGCDGVANRRLVKDDGV